MKSVLKLHLSKDSFKQFFPKKFTNVVEFPQQYSISFVSEKITLELVISILKNPFGHFINISRDRSEIYNAFYKALDSQNKT